MSGNVAGQAFALTVLTPIMPGSEDALRAYLEQLPRGGSPLAKLPRTHFGRWVIVPEIVNDPEQPSDDHLSCQYLLFTSNFDGSLDSYLDELCSRLAAEAREIWGRCVGCPPTAAGAELKAYLLRNQIDTGFFVAAYPDATVTKVKDSLRTRERLIQFAVRAQAMEPSELQRSFREEFAP